MSKIEFGKWRICLAAAIAPIMLCAAASAQDSAPAEEDKVTRALATLRELDPEATHDNAVTYTTNGREVLRAGVRQTMPFKWNKGVSVTRSSDGAQAVILLASPDSQCCALSWAIAEMSRAQSFARVWTEAANGVLSPESLAEAEKKRFEAHLQEYRKRASDPELPEEARRYKIHAEMAVKNKAFERALVEYEHLLAIAPWWPTAYFNKALLLGERGSYADAIDSMKRYLLLAPNASNARAAQDKIYEWEGSRP